MNNSIITQAEVRSQQIADNLFKGAIRLAQAKEFKAFRAKYGRPCLLEEVHPVEFRSLGEQVSSGYDQDSQIEQ